MKRWKTVRLVVDIRVPDEESPRNVRNSVRAILDEHYRKNGTMDWTILRRRTSKPEVKMLSGVLREIRKGDWLGRLGIDD